MAVSAPGSPCTVGVTLEPLPRPVYIVVRNHKHWEDLMGGEMPATVDEIGPRIVSGEDCWTVNAYVQLKLRGLDVRIVPNFVPGEICVIANECLAVKDRPYRSFVVCCQHDRYRPEICDYRIVQNPLNIEDPEHDIFIPLWPQPGLIPRDASRGARVDVLGFRGLEIYIAPPFRSDVFKAALQERGIHFEYSKDEYEARKVDWSDYTNIDVVLAVRNCTEYDFNIKPPSKLINSWFAGCPALLGKESAYQALRKSELDYIEVHSAQDVLDALDKLRADPGLYAAMVQNGYERAPDFTADTMAKQWRDFLAGPVYEGFQRWQAQNPIEKLVGRPLEFLSRVQEHRAARAEFYQRIHEGPRPYDDWVEGQLS